MAQQPTPSPKGPADHLTAEPEAFEFFQAVRLLEREAASGSSQSALHSVGADAPPGREIVRFRTLASQRFPPAPIASLKRPAEPATNKPAEMELTFLGLTGPSGVLPGHYSQLVIETVRNKEYALRDFLDLFNHRLASLFYRAWGKYRLPIAFEAAQTSTGQRRDDPCTVCLYALVGLGHARLRQRMEFDDLVAVYFSGYLGHYPRNAVSLQALVSEFLAMRVEVRQFQGQWLSLDSSDQTRLGSRGAPAVSMRPSALRPWQGGVCGVWKANSLCESVLWIIPSFGVSCRRATCCDRCAK